MSNLIEQAIKWATKIHAGQERKDGTPFITHPLKVAELVESIYKDNQHYSEDVKIAAILHDTVEDHPDKISFNMISELFGSKVAEYVQHLTKRKGQSKIDYYYHMHEFAPAQVIWIKFCDRLANLQDTLALEMTEKNRTFASYYVRDTTELLDRVGTAIEDKAVISLIIHQIKSILVELYYPDNI